MEATYKRVPKTGRFEGDPHLVWIAPNTFLFYQPAGEKPFSFTTHHAQDVPKGHGRGQYRIPDITITPGTMITTGASVPPDFWHIKGFSPWDYAQAAIIHDWLFEAHHRFEAGVKGYRKGEPKHDLYKDLNLADAADIFAECIHKNMELGERRTKYIESQQKAQADKETWKAIHDDFPDNKVSPFQLWAYHYAVSPDCSLSHLAQRMWDSRLNDVDVCDAILNRTTLGSEGFRDKIKVLRKESVEVNDRLQKVYERKKAATPAGGKLPAPAILQRQVSPSSAAPAKKGPAVVSMVKARV